MTNRGPRLVDHMLELVDRSGLTDQQIRDKFGLGITWLSDVRSGRNISPRVDTVQRLIEGLSGRPIISQQESKTW
ncbi:MAG: hypothetical protein ACRCYS_20110 [Beijerinckiaceae bacterium]